MPKFLRLVLSSLILFSVVKLFIYNEIGFICYCLCFISASPKSWLILSMYLFFEYVKHYLFLSQLSKKVFSEKCHFSFIFPPHSLFTFLSVFTTPFSPIFCKFPIYSVSGLYFLDIFFNKWADICMFSYSHYLTWKITWYRYLEITAYRFIESFHILFGWCFLHYVYIP